MSTSRNCPPSCKKVDMPRSRPIIHGWTPHTVDHAGVLSPTHYDKNATSWGDTGHGHEDQSSRSNTPSMTRGSSRSTTSSIVACDQCANPCESCLCHSVSDTESVRYQPSDIESGANSSTTPEISQVGFIASKQKDRTRFPVQLAGERLLCRATSVARSIAIADPMLAKNYLTRRVEDHQGIQEAEKPSQLEESPSAPVPDPLVSASNAINQQTAFTGAIECANSDSDNSDDDVEEEDDDEDDDSWSGQDYNLEARILQAVDYNLPLAAHLIPLLHKVIYAEFASSITQKVGGWRQSVAKGNPADGESNSQKSPSSRASTNNSNNDPRKRQRNLGSARDAREVDEEGDEDEEDEDDNRDPKRFKDEPESPGRSPHPLLACPFHKRDPQKYNTQHDMVENARKSMYRTCAGPGFKSIQRLMEHLRRKHNPVQCDRCYRIFDGQDRANCMLELKKHHQLLDPCELNPSGTKEGISDFQWAIIEKKRSKKSIQGLSSVEKWNDIWSVLFPEIQHPQTPWYDQHFNKLPPRSPSEECNHFLDIYRVILHHKVDQQDICLGPDMEERVINVAKQAFDLWSSTHRSSGPNSSSYSSSARIYSQPSQPSLLSGSYQVVHVPKANGRHRFPSVTESSAVRSESYSTAFSHGSTEGPGMVKPRRNPSETPGHNLPTSYAPMQSPYQGYNNNAMVTGVFPVGNINDQYPMDMALDEVNLTGGADPLRMTYAGESAYSPFNPNEALEEPFPNSATGISPSQTILRPLDGRTQNLARPNWSQYPPTGQHYGGRR